MTCDSAARVIIQVMPCGGGADSLRDVCSETGEAVAVAGFLAQAVSMHAAVTATMAAAADVNGPPIRPGGDFGVPGGAAA